MATGWFDQNSPGSVLARGGNVGTLQQPNAFPTTGPVSSFGAPPPAYTPPAGGVPSTPGDPTHGGLFPAGGGGTTGGDLRSQVVALATQAGRPDIAANPQYWMDEISGKGQGPGGANGAIDSGFWLDKMKNANGGLNGASTTGSGGSIGSFLQPFTGTFSAPKGTDDPGFQFAVQQGQDAIQRSAAAKGNLLTGGTLKDLASYTTGAALQDYSGAYNRALQTFGTNYDVFRNNQTDPYNKLMGVTGLGLNATNASNATGSSYLNNLSGLSNNYSNTQGNQTISQGNIGAQNTINAGNNLSSAFGAMPKDWYKNWSNPFAKPQPVGTGSDVWF